MKNNLSIGLGGNIASSEGFPQKTLIAARPIIEKAIKRWSFTLLPENSEHFSIDSKISFCWSPLYKTKPIGGPSGQPSFINTVLIVHGEIFANLSPSTNAATNLLKVFFSIEKKFGRDRQKSNIHWGPRTLDIDILAWGDLQINSSTLILPHPRLTERGFVMIPFAEAIKKLSDPIIQIQPQMGWDE